MCLRKFSDFKMIKNEPPDRILEHFLYQTDLKQPAQFTGTIKIPENPKIRPKSTRFVFQNLPTTPKAAGDQRPHDKAQEKHK